MDALVVDVVDDFMITVFAAAAETQLLTDAVTLYNPAESAVVFTMANEFVVPVCVMPFGPVQVYVTVPPVVVVLAVNNNNCPAQMLLLPVIMGVAVLELPASTTDEITLETQPLRVTVMFE